MMPSDIRFLQPLDDGVLSGNVSGDRFLQPRDFDVLGSFLLCLAGWCWGESPFFCHGEKDYRNSANLVFGSELAGLVARWNHCFFFFKTTSTSLAAYSFYNWQRPPS
jgi:hypothetical protein